MLPLKFSVTHSCSKIEEIDKEYIMITLQWSFPLAKAWVVANSVFCMVNLCVPSILLITNHWICFFYNFSLSFCIFVSLCSKGNVLIWICFELSTVLEIDEVNAFVYKFSVKSKNNQVAENVKGLRTSFI